MDKTPTPEEVELDRALRTAYDRLSVLVPVTIGHDTWKADPAVKREFDAACAELTRLTAERNALREALRPFADLADLLADVSVSDGSGLPPWPLKENTPLVDALDSLGRDEIPTSMADLRRARAALEPDRAEREGSNG